MKGPFSEKEAEGICLRLLRCDSEADVTSTLRELGFLDDEKCWKDLGDSPANWSIAGNQQAFSTSALVEKLVNSIDAVLIDECIARGIDPRSSAAPKSMREAVEKFFKVPDGLLEKLDPKERTTLAQRIHLVATGEEGKDPNYTIIDTGEGQTPDTLPETILSLPGTKPTSKSKIKFVQGIFNMGGTGALRFCGYHNYQLVVSRRDPRLAKEATNERDLMWCFTLIRRTNPAGVRESSVYEYLAPNGKILAFRAQSIPALPGEFPKAYSKPLTWGTCIKLYEYEIRPKALGTNAILDLNYELSRHFQEMALPIRISERRGRFSGHTFETNLAGMAVRLSEDRSKIIEPNFPSSGFLQVSGIGEIGVTLYAFTSAEKNRWVGDKPIVLTVNGQTHGIISKSFFSRDKVNLSWIADDLLVILDCSRIDGRAREDLFMASRDRLKEGKEQDALKDELAEFLGTHQGLQQLAHKRREEAIKNAIGDERPLKDVLGKLIRNSPSLADIFAPGSAVNKDTGFNWVKVPDAFEGKPFPSFFRLAGGVQAVEKECAMNSYCLIRYETDARNDYFTRSRSRGAFTASRQSLDSSLNLWNGIATYKIRPPSNAKVGDKLVVETQVTDKTQKNPFKSKITITFVEAIIKTSHIGGKRRGGGREKEITEGEGETGGISIPNPIKVRKGDTNWNKYNFTEKTGLRLVKQGENFDALVNMDNEYLRKELGANKRVQADVSENQFLTGLILSSMAIYYTYHAKKQAGNGSNGESKEDFEQRTFDIISDTSEALALVILPMVNSLGEISKKLEAAIN